MRTLRNGCFRSGVLASTNRPFWGQILSLAKRPCGRNIVAMSGVDPEEKGQPQILSGSLAALSLDVFFSDYRPKPPEFPQPLALTWSDVSARIPTGRLEIRGSTLVLRINSEDANQPFNPFEYEGTRNESATIELSDGSAVRTPFASLSQWGIGGDVEGKPYWSEWT